MKQSILKNIIEKYNFAEEEFKFLPPEILKVDKKKLSSMDKAILDGIKFQITVSKANTIYHTIKNAVMIQDSRFRIQDFKNSSSLSINHYSLSLNLLPQYAFTGATLAVFVFFLLSITYYANVNLHLGINFLTDFFA